MGAITVTARIAWKLQLGALIRRTAQRVGGRSYGCSIDGDSCEECTLGLVFREAHKIDVNDGREKALRSALSYPNWDKASGIADRVANQRTCPLGLGIGST